MCSRSWSWGLSKFSDITDAELDHVVEDYISWHGPTRGQSYLIGHLRSLGLQVQRDRVRSSLTRVDPDNTLLHWAAVISRCVYSVPWPNSLWHMGVLMAFPAWLYICIVPPTIRLILFWICFSEEQLNMDCPFVSLVIMVEKTCVAELMTQRRGDNRGSFIAGPSTRNQGIEKLWCEVFRLVSFLFSRRQWIPLYQRSHSLVCFALCFHSKNKLCFHWI